MLLQVQNLYFNEEKCVIHDEAKSFVDTINERCNAEGLLIHGQIDFIQCWWSIRHRKFDSRIADNPIKFRYQIYLERIIDKATMIDFYERFQKYNEKTTMRIFFSKSLYI